MKTVAYVGVGHIHTPRFVEFLNQRPDVQVKAVWDSDPERAQITSQKLNTQTVADVTEIWQNDAIDAVVICSETNRHEDLVLAAAASKKHLFVEKPLGMTGSSAYRMAHAIEDAGVLFQTGYFQRGSAAHQFLKAHIDQGHFGKITRVRHSNCHSGSIGRWFDAGKGWFPDGWMWMTNLEQAGVGAFGDLGTHSLDILMWLAGDIESVTADVNTALGNYACDEYGEALIRFRSGVIGTLAAGWVDVQNPVTVVVSGTEGHATVINRKVFFKSTHVPGADGETPWQDLPAEQPHAFMLFLDALNGADVTLVSPREAAERSVVMEAMYRAAETRTWQSPEKLA